MFWSVVLFDRLVIVQSLFTGFTILAIQNTCWLKTLGELFTSLKPSSKRIQVISYEVSFALEFHEARSQVKSRCKWDQVRNNIYLPWHVVTLLYHRCHISPHLLPMEYSSYISHPYTLLIIQYLWYKVHVIWNHKQAREHITWPPIQSHQINYFDHK